MKKRVLKGLLALILLAGVLFITQRGAAFVSSRNVTADNVTVVVDPGHGGRDPGKVGVVGEIDEKEINLKIGLYLKEYLEAQGVTVVMTRDSDIGLYSESSSNKKREDLNNRLDIINNSEAALAVGIHQNSFTQSQYRGAQVFYYEGSENGLRLATALQDQLREGLDPSNTRTVKANTDYFLTKNSSIPMVIIESGFLSNPEECELLSTDEYQKKVAENIGIGIINYIKYE